MVLEKGANGILGRVGLARSCRKARSKHELYTIIATEDQRYIPPET